MREKKAVEELIKVIERNRAVLKRIDTFYTQYRKDEDISEQKVPQAIVIADTLSNYYTCLETIFLRISQFFENRLVKSKWHQDLLEKMTLEVDDTRVPVITDKTYHHLLELLKFRHFKRYYFDFDYDWDKLRFLDIKFQKASCLVEKDLDRFVTFLREI